MAVLTYQRSSDILQVQTIVTIVLPDNITSNTPLPVLWLLHGLGDNGSAWQRKTAIELIASTHQLAIIMPDCGRGFYTNTASGTAYADYLTDELIPQMRRTFNLSKKPSQNFIGGNSMGGYGAFKLATSHPDWFSKVALISPVTNLKSVPDFMTDYEAVFGPNGEDIFKLQPTTLVEKADLKQLQQLKWYHTIGNDDFMKKDNDAFAHYLQDTLKLDITYQTAPGGHDWYFWNDQIAQIIPWLMA